MAGSTSGGAASASTVRPRNANGAGLRNSQKAVGMIFNEERLQRLRSFAEDKVPELLGDLFCPWAKWIFVLFKFLVENIDNEAKLVIARIFGMSNLKSPLQLVVSRLRSASEEVLNDAAEMADAHASGLFVCRLTSLMLLMVIGDFGWKGLIGLHLGLFVAKTELQFSVEETDDLVFQLFHVCLHILDAIVTPRTFSSRFLLHLLSCVCVFFCHFNVRLGPRDFSMAPILFFPCVLVILFYTPLWFGVCVLFAIFAMVCMSDPDDLFAAVIGCTCTFSVVRGLVYVSAGGFCGALFLFLCSLVVFVCVFEDDKISTAVEMMVAPLPLVCALLSCFYTPFWVGLCFTSMLFCTLAVANSNVKAILWWFASFAALHSMSYAFSRDFPVIAICFLGSYFSYGSIL